MVYHAVKISERRYLIAREGFTSVMTAVAECRSESAAVDLVKALNASPQSEALAVIGVKEREAKRTADIKGAR
jgi:hypothetical protein